MRVKQYHRRTTASNTTDTTPSNGKGEYRPQQRQREILAAAWTHVQSVAYRVSLRWLFYRLLQDGYYSTKKDYRGQFKPLMSRARHRQLDGWRITDTLTDEVRSATYAEGSTGPGH